MNPIIAPPKRNRESLLVRKVATSAVPVLMTSQSNNRARKLRHDLEQQMRNKNDDHSLQVFIRLMRAGHFIDDDVNTEDTRPLAPPTTPVPAYAPGHNVSDDDVTIADYTSKSSASWHKSRRSNKASSTSSTPQPGIMLNTWMGSDVIEHHPWLVMRGRNIRLQHQDHVKSALTGQRLVQSASHAQVKTCNNYGKMSPRLKLKGHYYTSHEKTRVFEPSQIPPQRHCHSNGAFPAPTKIRFHENNHSKKQDNRRCYSGRELGNTPDITKSLVIKIPYVQTRPSP